MFTHWAAAPRDPQVAKRRFAARYHAALPNVQSCSLQELCLSAGLDRGELHQIEALITGRVHVKLEDLARRVVPLQRNLHKIISTEAVRGHNLMLLLGSMRAKRASCGLPARPLAPLCRTWLLGDPVHASTVSRIIGSYLGLQLETFSRLFSRFQAAGLLQVQGKFVKLLDLPGIRQIAGAAN